MNTELRAPKEGDGSKIYVIVKRGIPLGIGVNSVGHACTYAHEKWKGTPGYDAWFANSFRKVTVTAKPQAFEKLKNSELEHLLITECALDYEEVVLIFYPQTVWPKPFKRLQLLGQGHTV